MTSKKYTRVDKDVLIECEKSYLNTNKSIPQISKEFNVNSSQVKYYLKKVGHKIEKRGNGHLGLTRSESTKMSISKSKINKPNYKKRGTTYSSTQRLNIISSQMTIKIDIHEFIEVDKFLMLKEWAMYKYNLKLRTPTTLYEFIRHFYYSDQFNCVYEAWIKSGKNVWYKPSLDHIIPVSKGGLSELSNLQVLTRFENKCKCNMLQTEWDDFKKLTNTNSDLFIK